METLENLKSLKGVPQGAADEAIRHELALAEVVCVDAGTQSTVGVESQLIGVLGLGITKPMGRDRFVALQRRCSHWELRATVGPFSGDKGKVASDLVNEVIEDNSPSIVPFNGAKGRRLQCFRVYSLDALQALLAALKKHFETRSLDKGFLTNLKFDGLFLSAEQRTEAVRMRTR